LSPTRASPALHRETSGGNSGGYAAPLVLLHGWGTNLRVFDGLRAALGAQHRVTAIDLPGHGRSPWTAPDSSRQQQLAELATMLPKGATLVGWSLGGQLALQLANERTLDVRRLVLIGSSPRFMRADDWAHGMPAVAMRQFAAELERDPAKTLADFLELQVRGSANATTVLAALQSSLRQHGAAHPEALAAALALLEHNDLRGLARRIDVPALVIVGQYDRVTPPQASEALTQLMPQAQLLQIPRAGHAPFLSHLAEVSTAILGFTRHDHSPRRSADLRVTGARWPDRSIARPPAMTPPRSCSSGYAPSCWNGCSISRSSRNASSIWAPAPARRRSRCAGGLRTRASSRWISRPGCSRPRRVRAGRGDASSASARTPTRCHWPVAASS
jgi:pimeloyl-[acyl-carrier protein] methyl ester esterase